MGPKATNGTEDRPETPKNNSFQDRRDGAHGGTFS